MICTKHLYKVAMEVNSDQAPPRYAVVTGSNKGIGLEIVRRLAKAGVKVVLTSRNEERGAAAVSLLHQEGLSNVVFHQLDVLDRGSIESLAAFVSSQFGRLDILVNNAGIAGLPVDKDKLRAMKIDPDTLQPGKAGTSGRGLRISTYESAKECLDTNYYGAKNVTEALLPLLQLSPGARIVNVSSRWGQLRLVPDEHRQILVDIETLTEEKIDEVIQQFLHHRKGKKFEEGRCTQEELVAPYSISKATLNAYARLLADKYPSMYVNCVHPGYVKTDINWHAGPITVEEGAEGPVMLALLPDGGPSGCYFNQTQVAEF